MMSAGVVQTRVEKIELPGLRIEDLRGAFFVAASNQKPAIREHLFGQANIGLLYSGNFGRAHSYEELLALARLLRRVSSRHVSACRRIGPIWPDQSQANIHDRSAPEKVAASQKESG